MSKIEENTNIKLYNYNTSYVAFKTSTREYVLEPASFDEDGKKIPTYELLTLKDLEYINAHSSVLRTGILVFEDNIKSDIYSTLHIAEEKIWFDDKIDDTLTNATSEKLIELLKIKDIITFERVRGRLAILLGDNIGITNRVIRLINERFKEINRGITVSEIKIEKVVKQIKNEGIKEDVTALQDKNIALENQLQQLMAQMELMQAQIGTQEAIPEGATNSSEKTNPATNTTVKSSNDTKKQTKSTRQSTKTIK